MRAAEFEFVVPSLPSTLLPLDSHQSSSRVGALGTLAFVAPAGLTLLAPFVMIAQQVAAEPAARQIFADRPASAALLVVGLVVWCALIAVPMSRALAGLSRRRHVRIAAGRVSVAERSLAGRGTWSEPLAAYAGVLHLVRTSLSGTRHEIVLVHPDAARSVLLAAAEQISEQQVVSTAAMLGTRIIPSSARYRLKETIADWAAEPAPMPLARAA